MHKIFSHLRGFMFCDFICYGDSYNGDGNGEGNGLGFINGNGVGCGDAYPSGEGGTFSDGFGTDSSTFNFNGDCEFNDETMLLEEEE